MMDRMVHIESAAGLQFSEALSGIGDRGYGMDRGPLTGHLAVNLRSFPGRPNPEQRNPLKSLPSVAPPGPAWSSSHTS